MPLYDYECKKCGEQVEVVYTVEKRPKSLKCKKCDGRMKQIIVKGHGGIQDDHPTWITNDLIEVLQDSDEVAHGREKRIETRQDVREHQKKKGIVDTHGTRLAPPSI